LVKPLQSTAGAVKTGIFARRNNKQAIWRRIYSSDEFERAFRGAFQYALDTGFTEILELKPGQEEALLYFVEREGVFAMLPTGCGKSLIFPFVLKVCEYLHDQGFEYPRAAILDVVCPLSAPIDSHIQEPEERNEPKQYINTWHLQRCQTLRSDTQIIAETM